MSLVNFAPKRQPGGGEVNPALIALSEVAIFLERAQRSDPGEAGQQQGACAAAERIMNIT
jgi:hypothetical protein